MLAVIDIVVVVIGIVLTVIGIVLTVISIVLKVIGIVLAYTTRAYSISICHEFGDLAASRKVSLNNARSRQIS